MNLCEKILISEIYCWNPASIDVLNSSNRNIITTFEVCSKLTKKTPERRQWRHSGVFIVNLHRFHTLRWVFPFLTSKYRLKSIVPVNCIYKRIAGKLRTVHFGILLLLLTLYKFRILFWFLLSLSMFFVKLLSNLRHH